MRARVGLYRQKRGRGVKMTPDSFRLSCMKKSKWTWRTISFLFARLTQSDSWWRISNVSVGLRTIMEASCMPNKVFILPAVKIEGHGCSESFGSLPSRNRAGIVS